ncbi:MAG: OmpA family protein [Planctomycetaceae bacterium]|nr:OmpA family protein [Planctomycetaceae bacterium]
MAGGGGAWKVAYADFVTAMMAFFMVMWLTSQKPGIKEAVAGYFREPFATYKSHQKGAAGTARPVLDPMYGHTAQPQKRRLAISGDVTDYQFTLLFPEGSATLEPEQLESVREFAPMMAGKLNRVEVRAHCIRSPLPPDSPFQDHWAMCFARCQRVREELQTLGVEPERIRLSQAEGNEPLAANLSPDELKLNSRVDVILLPDLADIPWERRKAEEEPVEATMEPVSAQGMAHAEVRSVETDVTDVSQPHEAPAAVGTHASHAPGDSGDPHEPAAAHNQGGSGASNDAPASQAANDDYAAADEHGLTDAHHDASTHGRADSHDDAVVHGKPNAAAEHSDAHEEHGAAHPPAEVHVPPPH